MIVRAWISCLAPGAADRYRTFAQERSLPMFEGQPGCAGVRFVSLADGRQAVLTLWKDDCSLLMLEQSDAFRTALEASGVLEGAVCVRSTAVPPEVAEALLALSKEVA